MQALLLNSASESLSFLSEKRSLKLLFSGHVDAVAFWDKKFHWSSGSQFYPAILKLRYYIRPFSKRKRFHRNGVFQRDRYSCAYCNVFLGSRCTIDHIIPRDAGGRSSWENCVTSCFTCNNRKSNRTPDQAGMKLLFKPLAPGGSLIHDYERFENKHPEWKYYINYPI